MRSIERNTILFGSETATTPIPRTSTSATGENTFASSLARQICALRAQSVDLLIDSVTSSGSVTANRSLFELLANASLLSGSSSSISALSATGRNLSLTDPESAYRMMTEINRRDALYKAQSSELSEMKSGIAALHQAGQQLSNALSEPTDNNAVRAQLQTFVGKYNEWVQRFESSVDAGGILEGTQAAEIALYEFEQSLQNGFYGAALGQNGLKDIGITIDPATHLASLNEAQFNAALATSRQASLATLTDFSASFTDTAKLLGSENSFIAHRIDNLERAIDYIDDNTTSLQAEFGLGDPAKLSATMAQAVASYNQMHAL